MSKVAKFSELAAGTCFDYRGRVYRKLRMNLAEDEERVRAMFPSDVEVAIVEMPLRVAAHTEEGQVIPLNASAKTPPIEGVGLASRVAGSDPG
jgi:hypothetical protein